MNSWNHWIAISLACGTALYANSAQAGPSVCDTTSSGLDLCVRFDNSGTTPEEGVDFTFDLTTDPDNPSVNLVEGDNGLGTTYEWRVWCKDSSGFEANIGTISGLGAEDYQVTILTGENKPGAANVGSINLDTGSTSNYSRILGGEIAGSLTGTLYTEDTSGGTGGEVTLEIQGDVASTATLTIEKAVNVQILGDVDGEMNIGVIPGGGGVVTIGGNLTATGNISVGSAANMVFESDVAGTLDVDLIPEDSGNVTIEGSLTFSGAITVGGVEGGSYPGTLYILNDAAGDITMTNNDSSTGLTIDGDLSGDVMPGLLGGGVMRVRGDVAAASTIQVGSVPIYSELVLGEDASNIIAGDILFTDDIENGGHVYISGTFNGEVDLNDHDVNGHLFLNSGGSGTVVDGGDVTSTGIVVLGGATDEFTGAATFASVAGTVRSTGDMPGTLYVTGAVQSTGTLDFNGNFDGLLEVNDDMAGTIDIEDDLLGDLVLKDDLASGADVLIGGEIQGDLSISGDAAGDITVGSDLRGDIEIVLGLSSTGSITIGDSIGTTGRILIDGLLDGALSVATETVALSQIRAEDGLGSNGCVTINANQGSYDANGIILFGPAGHPSPLPSVTYDGGVRIMDNSGTGSNGDLAGSLTVTGCHASSANLDVCPDGTVTGSVTIYQPGCANQVTYSAVCGCP